MKTYLSPLTFSLVSTNTLYGGFLFVLVRFPVVPFLGSHRQSHYGTRPEDWPAPSASLLMAWLIYSLIRGKLETPIHGQLGVND